MVKVMIVDDEPYITSMLEKALSKNTEIRTVAFNNPITALAQLDSYQPDVVLLDIMMPEMDGIDVLNEIVARKPETKVIMMTAYSTLDRVLASHKKGAHDYVLKPFKSLKEIEDKCLEVKNPGAP